MNFDTLKKLLVQKLTHANFNVTETAQAQLTHYLLLLEKWNQTYNLTSVRDVTEMITQHILDSLSVKPFIHGQNILDVGTGAGLPGIPLACTLPEQQFVLLDSNGKKTRFLTHVIQTLDIKNVQVVQARVEEFSDETLFDSIISRAFSSIDDFLTKTAHLCRYDGVFLAMKGVYPAEELAAIQQAGHSVTTHALQISGLNAQRHLIVISANKH